MYLSLWVGSCVASPKYRSRFSGADDLGQIFVLDCTPILANVAPSNLLDPSSASSSIKLEWSVLFFCRSLYAIRRTLEVTGTPPLARSFHSLDIVGDRLFVFGGITIAVSNSSDFYILDLHQNKWTRPLYDGK